MTAGKIYRTHGELWRCIKVGFFGAVLQHLRQPSRTMTVSAESGLTPEEHA